MRELFFAYQLQLRIYKNCGMLSNGLGTAAFSCGQRGEWIGFVHYAER